MDKIDQKTLLQKLTDRDRLFYHYSKRCDEIDSGYEEKLAWFHDYALNAFAKYIHPRNHSDKVLDIGCSRGYLLSVLYAWGFKNLTGIDLSPNDISHAKVLAPEISFEKDDAFEYLAKHQNTFDIIISKAVLEHIEKKRVFEFIEKCYEALTPKGILILDVPNMDWLFASHERYMDFTHEVGFTIISLKQIMGEVFSKVETHPIDFYTFQDKKVPFYKKAKRNLTRIFARKLLNTLFEWADPQGCSTCNPIWQRSILGVGYKL
ncbi:MAG: class I SAM-dependent methyltransferase [Simkaniaceae bacterium]